MPSSSDLELNRVLLTAVMEGMKQAGRVLGVVVETEIAAGRVSAADGTVVLETTLAALAGLMKDLQADIAE